MHTVSLLQSRYHNRVSMQKKQSGSFFGEGRYLPLSIKLFEYSMHSFHGTTEPRAEIIFGQCKLTGKCLVKMARVHSFAMSYDVVIIQKQRMSALGT